MVVTKKATDCEICKKKIITLLESLGIKYKNTSNYILAFIHKSLVNERPDFAPTHNERLEFLWDAVLELVITSRLFNEFPEKQEWELTDLRSALVRWKNLANIAKNLWLNKYLYLWKWEELWGWRTNNYILANTVEAFLWALYLDLWFEEASEFINKHIYTTLGKIMEERLFKDAKTTIQEYAQAEFDITPIYKVLDEFWPDHEKNFTVGVFLWDKQVWTWKWWSKKKAQEKAAEDWLENLKK